MARFTVVAEIWNDEEPFTAQVEAHNPEAAGDVANRLAAIEDGNGDMSEEEMSEHYDGAPLRIWSIIEGWVTVVSGEKIHRHE